jgi:hypothetical protein
MRELGRPLRNTGKENRGRDKDNDTYNFHAAIHTTRHKLVLLDVRPVYTIDLTRMFMPSTDGEILGHLSYLHSLALRRGIGVGAYVQHYVPEFEGTIAGCSDKLIFMDLGPRQVVQSILRFVAGHPNLFSTTEEKGCRARTYNFSSCTFGTPDGFTKAEAMCKRPFPTIP